MKLACRAQKIILSDYIARLMSVYVRMELPSIEISGLRGSRSALILKVCVLCRTVVVVMFILLKHSFDEKE